MHGSGDEECAEALVDNLSVEGGNLVRTNLAAALSNSDLEQLNELSHDLTTEMEQQQQDEEMIESEDMDESMLQEEEDPIGSPEMKIELKKSTMPPLRPLTIAPKPTKLPISFKPMAGQQLLLVQGNSGQQIKLLNAAQGLNLSNLTLAKPVTVKTKNLAMLTQPKQLVMKKVVTQMPKNAYVKNTFAEAKGQQIVVVQKSEPQQQIKLIQSGAVTTATKTLTFAQAQQMGIISGTKLMTHGSKQVILNKNQAKTIKLVPQQVRSPTKILPAPLAISKTPQRIYLKHGVAGGMVSGQILQVTGNQSINTGQLHQINIPGKGMQYIKFVSQPETSTTTVIHTTKAPVAGTKLIPISSTSSLKGNLVELKTVPKPSFISKVAKASPMRSVNLNLSTSGGQQVVMLPAAYVSRATASTTTSAQQPITKIAIPSMKHKLVTTTKTASSNSVPDSVPLPTTPTTPSPELSMESNGMRPRKPCNCTKSQCLKLYCDCFANGEFCYKCNCMNCFNNLENEEHRQRAIKNCLERNPNAFRPKIGKAKDTNDAAIRKHTKGCNCKRSGCLKNYCECYEAKIACSSNCKCVGCRNIEDAMDKKSSRSSILSDSSFSTSPQSTRKHITDNFSKMKSKNNNKQAFNFITNDVIEATCQCLLTLSSNAEESEQDEEATKQQIIDEFGRCLKQIIDCSLNKPQQR